MHGERLQLGVTQVLLLRIGIPLLQLREIFRPVYYLN